MPEAGICQLALEQPVREVARRGERLARGGGERLDDLATATAAIGLHGDIAMEEIQQQRAAAAEQSRLASRRPRMGADVYARLYRPEATIRGTLALAGPRGVPRRKIGTSVRKQPRQD